MEVEFLKDLVDVFSLLVELRAPLESIQACPLLSLTCRLHLQNWWERLKNSTTFFKTILMKSIGGWVPKKDDLFIHTPLLF